MMYLSSSTVVAFASLLMSRYGSVNAFAPNAARLATANRGFSLNVVEFPDNGSNNQRHHDDDGVVFDSHILLANSNLAGNWGFDPLHLAQTQEQLMQYREAEMKHARIAMLAVVAWMWSELQVVDTMGATPFFEDRAFPEWMGACVGFPAAIELYGDKKAHDNHDNDPGYFPGNLGMDPLHLYPANEEGRKLMQLGEIVIGRVSMMAASMLLAQSLLSVLGLEQEQLLSWIPAVAAGDAAVEQLTV